MRKRYKKSEAFDQGLTYFCKQILTLSLLLIHTVCAAGTPSVITIDEGKSTEQRINLIKQDWEIAITGDNFGYVVYGANGPVPLFDRDGRFHQAFKNEMNYIDPKIMTSPRWPSSWEYSDERSQKIILRNDQNKVLSQLFWNKLKGYGVNDYGFIGHFDGRFIEIRKPGTGLTRDLEKVKEINKAGKGQANQQLSKHKKATKNNIKELYGIGASLNSKATKSTISNEFLFGMPLYIEGVVISGPADNAGLMPGDKIVTINGKKSPKRYKQAVSMIRGAEGTAVDLEIERNGEFLSYKIIRDKIEPSSKIKWLPGGPVRNYRRYKEWNNKASSVRLSGWDDQYVYYQGLIKGHRFKADVQRNLNGSIELTLGDQSKYSAIVLDDLDKHIGIRRVGYSIKDFPHEIFIDEQIHLQGMADVNKTGERCQCHIDIVVEELSKLFPKKEMTLDEYKFCRGVDSIIELAKEEDRLTLDQLSKGKRVSNKMSDEVPALYEVDLTLDGFTTLGVNQKRSSIYFERKPHRVEHWTQFVRDTLKTKCNLTDDGILYSDLIPWVKDIDVYQFFDKEFYTNIDFPVSDNAQDLLVIDLHTANGRKNIEKSINAAKSKKDRRERMARREAERKKDSTLINTGSKPVFSTMQRKPRAATNTSNETKKPVDITDLMAAPKNTKKRQNPYVQEYEQHRQIYSCYEIRPWDVRGGGATNCIAVYVGATPPIGGGWNCGNSSIVSRALSDSTLQRCP